MKKVKERFLFDFSWLARTDPSDVARVESKTFMSTYYQRDSIPIPKTGVQGQLGNWIAPDDLDSELNMRFPGCMRGNIWLISAGSLQDSFVIRFLLSLEFQNIILRPL